MEDETEMESSLKRSHQPNDVNDALNSEPNKKKSRISENDNDDVKGLEISVTGNTCDKITTDNISTQNETTNIKDDLMEITGNEKEKPADVQSKSGDVLLTKTHETKTNSSESDSAIKVKTDSSHKDEKHKDENNTSKSNPPPSDFGVRKTEIDVGITEYLGSPTESFSAIIKQRYSDFIVNEIDENGAVVHLKKVTHEEEEEGGGGDSHEDKKSKDEPLSVLSEADQEAIQKIVTDRDKDAFHHIPAPDDKALRTKIHLAVKQTFSQLETSTTENGEGQKVIKVAWRKGKSRDAIRDEWPQSKKSCRYVRFVLYKENKDTMDAIGLIAKNLKVRESMFQYAGSKDKRAKTTQEITAHRIHPRKLVNLNKVLWNMGLGDFRYVEQPLQLGQLTGNHFTIVLRNVQASVKTVDKALTSLKERGFINYFGMQRFGTTAIPTHRIGSALLKGDWEGAIDLILAPRNDIPAKDKFQRKWGESRDPAMTLDLTPRYCGLERNILEALVKKAKPFNALEKLPRNTRLLYIHSYQSLIWNKMASHRLSRLGHSVVVGDLVLDRQPWEPKGTDSNSSSLSSGTKPVVVTADTLNQYKLTDVVLPLPGYDVIYPNNSVAEWYKDLLSADGLDINNMKRAQKDYSLSGAYRHLVILPKDVSWSHHRYQDYTQQLTLSDFDLIQGEQLHTLDDEQKGDHGAVVLGMSLPSSCYATMALREAMKIDTSSVHQTSLNQAS